MQGILAELSSPTWWFTAIFVALTINIISSYCKPWIDTFLSKISTAWRTRSEKARQRFNADVNKLIQSPQALSEASEAEVRARLRTIKGMLLFITMVLLLNLIAVAGIGKGSTPPSNISNELILAADLISRGLALTFLMCSVLVIMSHAEAMSLRAKIKVARRILIRHELQRQNT